MVIDFQWYRYNNGQVIPKELASCDNNSRISHFLFKPIASYGSLSDKERREAMYVFSHHHGLRWDDGFIKLSEFDKIVERLCWSANVVYVKGREKVDFLKRILPCKRIVDVREAGKISPKMPKCMFHTSNYCVCALVIVQELYEFLVNNKYSD